MKLIVTCAAGLAGRTWLRASIRCCSSASIEGRASAFFIVCCSLCSATSSFSCCMRHFSSLCNRRKEMVYLTMHSTHFIYGYMVKDHSDSEKGNQLPPHRLLFPINSKGSFISPSHRQDSTYHGLCYTSRGALAGTRNSSMGPPHEGSIRRHRTMSERSYHGATSRSHSGMVTTHGRC